MELQATVVSSSLTYDQMLFLKTKFDEALTQALQIMFDTPPADLTATVTVK